MSKVGKWESEWMSEWRKIPVVNKLVKWVRCVREFCAWIKWVGDLSESTQLANEWAKQIKERGKLVSEHSGQVSKVSER